MRVRRSAYQRRSGRRCSFVSAKRGSVPNDPVKPHRDGRGRWWLGRPLSGSGIRCFSFGNQIGKLDGLPTCRVQVFRPAKVHLSLKKKEKKYVFVFVMLSRRLFSFHELSANLSPFVFLVLFAAYTLLNVEN